MNMIFNKLTHVSIHLTKCLTVIFVLLSHVGYSQYTVNFETATSGNKTTYATGTVILNDIQWEMTEGLIGTLAGDKKTGSRSLRMRRNGTVPGVATMLSDKLNGVGTISFQYARYGTESGQPNLFVEYSVNGGSTWIQAGMTITSFPSNLTTWSTAINQTGNVRIRFRTNTGGTNRRRFNIDNIVLTNYPPVCTQPTAWITLNAPTEPTPLTISTCTYAGEYNTINNLTAGATYAFNSSVSTDWLVLTDASNNILASGTTPLNYTASFNGTVKLHVSTNNLCGTQSACRTTSITCTSCLPPPPGPCIQPVAFATVAAPSNPTPLVISSCTYAGEYNTITNVVIGQTYEFTSTVTTDWLTLTDVSNNSLTFGTSLISWVATFSGTVKLHVSVSASCGTQSVCRTTTVTCTSCLPPPTVSSFTPSSVCINDNQSVVIVGTNFTDVTAVSFGGTAATSFTVNSATQITATVGNGTTGTITVATLGGTTTSSNILSVNVPPNQPSIVGGTTNVCYGGSNGSVDLMTVGGTSPYTYLWNNGATTEDLTGLTAGTYTVTVTDANNCTTTASVTITQPASGLTANITQTNVLIHGDTTGVIDLTVAGGTAPYSYNWSNGATTEDLANLAAGTYNVTVTDINGCQLMVSITIEEPIDCTVGDIEGAQILCGYSQVSYTIEVPSCVANYYWSMPQGMTIIDTDVNMSGYVSVDVFIDQLDFISGDIIFTAVYSGGLSVVTLAVSQVPFTPEFLTTSTCGIPNTTATFEVVNVIGVDSYNWTQPNLSSLLYGQNTDSVRVKYGSLFNSGMLSVVATNLCGSSPAAEFFVLAPPAIPNNIQGSTTICSIEPSQLYYVDSVANASYYIWGMPNGATIISNPATNDSVNVMFQNFSSGVISVKSANTCGSSSMKFLTVSAPSIGAPSGISGPQLVCSYAGTGQIITYSTPTVAGITNYIWNVPSGATITSGLGTNTVGVVFANGFSGGNIGVSLSNGCSLSQQFILQLYGVSTSTQSIAINGSSNVCSFIGAGSTVYSVTPPVGANSYVWTVPSGATIISGSGTSSITVSFASSFQSGSLSVNISTVCGTTYQQSEMLSKLPADAGAISGPNCISIGSSYTYSIGAVTGATSYQWTIPSNATITSGQGTSSIVIQYLTSFSGGNITVVPFNSCGNGQSSSVSTIGLAPVVPSQIFGATSVCSGQTLTYYVTPVPTATYYIWAVPVGMAIIGYQYGDSIVVSVDNQFISGLISCKSVNDCGSSPMRYSSTISTGNCSTAIIMDSQNDPQIITNNSIKEIEKETITSNNNVIAFHLLTIYPNPVVKDFLFYIEGASNTIYIINIRNDLGQIVYSAKHKQHESIDILNLANGIYYITIIDTQGYSIMKTIIKQ
jgi:hypothetical protein